MGPFRVWTEPEVRLLHRSDGGSDTNDLWPQLRVFLKRCQTGIRTGRRILSIPPSSLRLLAPAVLAGASLSEAVFPSWCLNFWALWMVTAKRCFSESRVCAANAVAQPRAGGRVVSQLSLTPCEHSHPVTCQQGRFSTSRARSIFCFLEIQPSLKDILTTLNEKVWVAGRLDRYCVTL